MKKKTGKALYAFLVIFALMLATTLFACGEEKVKPIPEGPETGTYYYYTDAGDYIVTLSDGNKFSLILGDGAKFGTYTVDGTKLSFTFAKEEDGTATATIANNEVLTLTYKNSEMIFRRNTQYTVTFDTGSGSSVAAATVTNGKAISRPADPTLAGHRFIGWYTDTSYSAPYVFDITPVTSDITLYAQWGKVTPGQSEFEIKFDANGADVAYPNMQTIGGKLYDAPAPVREGYEFKGWWIGESADKLFALVTKDTEFKENSTLYALWQSTSSTGKLPAPIITVGDNKITWDGIAGATGYDWEVLDGSGKKIGGARISGTSADFAFAEQAAGEYTVKVTAVSSVSANSATATVYYKHKVLNKVSRFEVVEPSVLLFNAVANADAYYITVKCGDAEHSHESVLLGKNTSYNFSNCAMKEGGIEFTVTAVADGYASSESGLYSYERKLAEIDEIYVDEATQTVHWSSVPNATNYLVTVDCGNADHSHIAVNNGNKTSYCVKECENKDGKIQISVKPVSKGYNSPETVKTVSYNKKSLATPGNIVVNGSVVSWNEVNGATGYTLSVDGKTFTVTGESYDLNKAGITWSQEKDYVINVQANGAADSLWSDDVSVRYNSMSGALSYEDGKINWRGVLGATNYQIKLNNVIIGTVESGNTSAEIKFTKAGVNTVSVRSMGANGYSDWVSVDVFAYEIAFDSRMGSGADPNSLFLAVGDSIELPSSQRAGFELSGWYNAPSGNSSKFEDTVFTSAANMTLYAYWTPATFRVTYDFDGGSSDKTGKDVKYSQQYTLDVPVPDDTSTAFLGWFTAAGSDGARLTDEKGNCLSQSGWDYTEDRTVYAHWARVFSFTELPGGAGYAVTKGYEIDGFSEVTVPVTYNDKPVTVVESYAFGSCFSLVKINIPDTVEIIETTTAFSGCTRLAEVNIYHVEGNNDVAYWSEDGMIVHNNEVEGEANLIFVPKTKTGSVTVPYGVTNIVVNVFKESRISEVVIPSTVTYIERNAFYDCENLTRVTFLPAAVGETVKPLELSNSAFMYCRELKYITLPARLSAFDTNMFFLCGAISEMNIEKGGALSSADGMLVEGSTLVYCPTGREGKVTIPNGITTIGTNAFRGCSRITEIVIPNFVTGIDEYAFGECSRLTKVTFKGGAISNLEVGNYAFWKCYGLRTVEFENGSKITKIGNYAFSNCGALTSFTFPASLTEVGNNAFEECSMLRFVAFSENSTTVKFGTNVFKNCKTLTRITLSSTISEVPASLINSCDNLMAVEVDSKNTNFKSIDGVLFDKEVTEILFYPKNGGNYTLPASVTTIGAGVFKGRTGITSFTIGENVTEIKEEAFANCTSLKQLTFEPGSKELVIADAVKDKYGSYGTGVFQGCNLLERVTLPARLKNIPVGMFKKCTALEAAPIPTGVVSIGDDAFNECISLKEVNVPSSVKTIGSNAFSGPSYGSESAISKVTINEGVTSIGSKAFAYLKKITALSLPSTLTSVGSYAFAYCSQLATVTFEDITGTDESGKPNMLEVGDNVFASCSAMTSVTLPEGLKNMSGYMFSSCSNLTTITVPSTVTEIKAGWLSSCSKVHTVTFAVKEGTKAFEKGKYPTGSTGLFNSLSSLTTVENFGKRFTEVPDYAFNYCSKFTSIDLTGMTRIGVCAFQRSGLTSVTVPSSVTTIADNAFNSCSALQSVSLSESITVIDSYTFGSSGIETIDIPSSVTEIKANAFYGSKLTSVTIPKTVTAIGQGAFSNSTSLVTAVFETAGADKLTISEGTNEQGSIFYGCSALTSIINIPTRLEKLPKYAFAYAQNLTTVTFEKGGNMPLSIGMKAFFPSSNGAGEEKNSKLTSITLPARLGEIANLVFDNCTALADINIETDDTVYAGERTFKSKDGILYQTDAAGNFATLVLCPVAKSSNSENPIIIPNTVTSIADRAFNKCANVTAVTFESGGSEGLSIGTDEASSSTGVFVGSGITSISLPSRTVSIGKYAFAASSSSNAKITSVTFETEITSAQPTADGETQSVAVSRLDKIGEYAFQYAKITSVSIPLSVNSIGKNAFNGCSLLEEITVSGKIANLAAIFSGCNAVTNYVIENTDGALVISDNGVVFNYNADSALSKTELILYPSGKTETSYEIPSTVTSIGVNAFKGNTSLTSVVLPNGLKTIGEGAFASTALSGITIPASVTSIGKDAFKSCASLASVAFTPSAQESVAADLTIGESAFYGTALTSVAIPSRVVKLDANAFNMVKTLKTLAFEDNSKNIVFGNNIFTASGLTSVDFGENSDIQTISQSMFSYCKLLTAVELPAGLTSVGNSAFEGCELLQSLTLGNAVTAIGNSAFRGCKISSVTLPSSLRSIGSSAFENCKELTSLVIPEGVTNAGSNIINGSGVQTVTVPGSLGTIPNKLLYGASALTKVVLSEGITTIADASQSSNAPFSNSTTFKEITLPSTLEYIGKYAFWSCHITSIEIPANVTTIGEYAFANCYDLTSLTFEDGSMLETIGKNVFEGCEKLTSVEFKTESLKVLPEYAFKYCRELASVTLPEGLTTISANAFNGLANLKTVNIPSTVTVIDTDAFYGTGITEIVIPEGVTKLEMISGYYSSGIFGNCAELTKVVLPTGLQIIGDSTFQGCKKLTSIELPLGLIKIGESAFENTGLTSILIPGGVTSVEYKAFSSCGALETVEMDDGVVSIGGEAFSKCNVLETVIIPDSVISIGAQAFSGCTSLTSYTLTGENAMYAVENGVIYNLDKTTLIAFPAGKTGEVTIANTVTAVGDYAFAGSAASKIIFQSGLKRIGAYAFSEAQTQSVILPEGLETIGNRAFSKSAIQSIVIPESVLTVGTYLFSESALQSAEIKAVLSNLGEAMFYNCKSLTTVKLPEGLQNLGDPSKSYGYAFKGCSSLSSINIPSTLKTIGGGDFNGCTSLTEIFIPSTVYYVGNGAFYGWTANQKINIAASEDYVASNWCNDSSWSKWNASCNAVVTYDYTPAA